jgi:hypothetical protein
MVGLCVIKKAFQTELLKSLHKQFIPAKFVELDDFKKEFLPFWRKYVLSQEYGCLLIAGKKKYSPYAYKWFSDEKQVKEHVTETETRDE